MVSTENSEILPPLIIETMVNGGAGLARHDGRVIFIPHTSVGDKVICRTTKNKKHFSEAQIVELVEEGPQRRVPPCPVAGLCGGCQWQHLPYDEQRHWKEKLFRDTLIHQCGVTSEEVLPIISEGDEWFYRSRVQLKCHNSKAGFIVGFYRPKSRSVVSIDQCNIIAAPLNKVLTQLRNLFNGTVFADHIPQIDLAIDDHSRCAVTVHYRGREKTDLIDFLKQADLNADLLLQAANKRKLEIVKGRGILQIDVSDPVINLNYAVGSFAQINLEQNRKLVDTVVDLANLNPGMRIIDLYCGMGNFSLPLAQAGANVTGIEESSSSIKRAISNADLNKIDRADFICGCAEHEFKTIANQGEIDLLLLDPPRSGAYDIMTTILDRPPERIIYISCDPQTLARDLKILLHSSYRLISSQPFDLFPQTHHCESVTLLERI
jgi:23S rRNA (uracil1939-C5)-methyltransferase